MNPWKIKVAEVKETANYDLFLHNISHQMHLQTGRSVPTVTFTPQRTSESKLSCSQPKAHGVFTASHVLFQTGCRYAGKMHSCFKILCDSTWLTGIFSSVCTHYNSLTLHWSGQTSIWLSTRFTVGVFAFDNCLG